MEEHDNCGECAKALLEEDVELHRMEVEQLETRIKQLEARNNKLEALVYAVNVMMVRAEQFATSDLVQERRWGQAVLEAIQDMSFEALDALKEGE